MDNKRSAIVMGATSGIGYEVAIILARRGWRIGVAGRREDILAKMSDEIDGDYWFASLYSIHYAYGNFSCCKD